MYNVVYKISLVSQTLSAYKCILKLIYVVIKWKNFKLLFLKYYCARDRSHLVFESSKIKNAVIAAVQIVQQTLKKVSFLANINSSSPSLPDSSIPSNTN